MSLVTAWLPVMMKMKTGVTWIALAVLALMGVRVSHAQTLETLVSFAVGGIHPHAKVIQGSDGNFYGTTSFGRAGGGGTVFKMTPAGVLTTLVSFNASNGSYPPAGLVQGRDRNFYGTTATGGAFGGGTVFRINFASSSKTNLVGTTATFTVTASGTPPLIYQWLRNGTNLVNGGNISGANTATLVVSNVSFEDVANYWVGITNDFGSATSQMIALRVILPPPGYNLLASQQLDAGAVRLSYVGLTGTNYALERTFNLAPPNWVPLTTNPAGPGGLLVFTNTPHAFTNNFWGIRAVPLP